MVKLFWAAAETRWSERVNSPPTSTEYQWRRLGVTEIPDKQEPDPAARGYEAGYAEGLEAARQAHAEEAGELVSRLNSLCATLTEQTNELKHQLAGDVIAMVQQLFDGLLQIKLFQSQPAFERAVELLSSQLEDEDEGIEIHLHPADLSALTAAGVEVSNPLPLVADAEVANGCVRLVCGYKLQEFNPSQDASRLLASLAEPDPDMPAQAADD